MYYTFSRRQAGEAGKNTKNTANIWMYQNFFVILQRILNCKEMNAHIKNNLIVLSLIGILVTPFSYMRAQDLIAERHVPGKSDSLLIYKLPYVHVSDSGKNCLWNFADISLDSAKWIEYNYFTPQTDTTKIGLHQEHTRKYYQYIQDTLWMSGYETSHTFVHLYAPMSCLRFPFSYGDSLIGMFAGKGQYCHMFPLNIEGMIAVHADAVGILVLPDMTVDSSVRVHSLISYQEKLNRQNYITENRYQWFSSYCRYPLFETIHTQTINGRDTISTGFSYYFPQEEDKREEHSVRKDTIMENVDSLITDIAFLPNPVMTDLHISYTLVRDAQVYISLHYNGGITTYQTPINHEIGGAHSTCINMAGMPIGTYVVYIHADNTVVSGNIIKY